MTRSWYKPLDDNGNEVGDKIYYGIANEHNTGVCVAGSVQRVDMGYRWTYRISRDTAITAVISDIMRARQIIEQIDNVMPDKYWINYDPSTKNI